jgi:hypothetical protein
MMLLLAFISVSAFMWQTTPVGNYRSILAQQRDVPGSQRLDEANFKVNDVGLNAPYADVLRRLGAPQRTRREKILGKGCGAPSTKVTLYYPGLKSELYGPLAGNNFRVKSLEVTSADWEVALGVAIGMDQRTVRERLGKPDVEIADSGGEAFIYQPEGESGSVGLIFRGGRLTSIELAIRCHKARMASRRAL